MQICSIHNAERKACHTRCLLSGKKQETELSEENSVSCCTRDRTRTDKVVTPLEPETSASTNFATRVFCFSGAKVLHFSEKAKSFYAKMQGQRYSFSPKARSPASPSPGMMYLCSFNSSSMAPTKRVVSAGNLSLMKSMAWRVAMIETM